MLRNEGASQRRAELLLMQRRHGRLEVISRVQIVVARKFKKRTVQSIGAGAGDDVDHAAGAASKLGVKVAREQGEFLHRIGVRSQLSATVRAVVRETPGRMETSEYILRPFSGMLTTRSRSTVPPSSSGRSTSAA